MRQDWSQDALSGAVTIRALLGLNYTSSITSVQGHVFGRFLGEDDDELKDETLYNPTQDDSGDNRRLLVRDLVKLDNDIH